jgi:hypothetical protein
MKMKKIHNTLLFVLFAYFFTQAQSITLTPTGIKPGLVGGHPRLSWSAIQAISNPQDGDMVGDITFKCLRVYNGSKWVPISQNTEGPDMTLLASAGSIGYEFVNDLAIDASGNIYMAGSFQNTCNFSGTSKTSAGNSDLYVCKYSPTGTVLWIYTASGCIQDDFANAITIDATGNVYVAGTYGGAINFGGVAKTNAGNFDAFLLKLNAAGVQQWIQTGGGSGYDQAAELATDASGNIYIIGNMEGSVTFGALTANSISGFADFFLIKYNTAGTIQYIKNGFSSGDDYGTALIVDNTGNVIIFGNYYQSGQYGYFLCKYDNSLSNTLLWTLSSTPGDYLSAAGIATNGLGDLYLTGSFNTSLTIGTTVLTSTGSADIYFIKYDTNGNLLFAKSFGGPGYDSGDDIAFKSRVYITGSISSNAVFDNYPVPFAGDSDIFIAKFDDYTGDLYYIKPTGGKLSEGGSALKIDANNNIYLGGYFSGKSYFGNFEKDIVGDYDSFLMLIKE